jgi:hypothetical protein
VLLARSTALDPSLVPDQIDCLVGGKRQKEGPGILVLLQLRKPTVLGASTKALERTESNIFFIGHTTGRAMELTPRHFHHPKEIGVPELLGRLGITVLELSDPDPDHRE